MKKVLIAPNSFKGCASSIEVAKLLEKYLSLNQNLKIDSCPISDGGDGFLKVCAQKYDLEMLTYRITTPYDESTFDVQVGYQKELKTIYIESAKVLGLSIIPLEFRKVIKLSSKGMGELLHQIFMDIDENKLEVEQIIVGIGGTGINDLGLGMCSQFGLQLFDHFGQRLKIVPEEFYRVARIDISEISSVCKITCILDVENQLQGKSGATHKFAKQKGASPGEISVMEMGFSKIINLLQSNNISGIPDVLFGAGGGLAAGFQIFLNADCQQSNEFIINRILNGCVNNQYDYVITGEGKFDDQSLLGKGAYSVIKTFHDKTNSIFLCSGIVDPDMKAMLPSNVKTMQLLDFFTNESESILNFESGIQKACEIILKDMDS
ncbi:MAG: glycerate kinase [Ignavibacteriales bacterium]|nr:MAG: glycerate kinase [Ignavibacteriales bacterium]